MKCSADAKPEAAAIRIRTVTGAGVLPYVDDLARLRIEVFREFPYLYDGDTEYERTYLRNYSCSPRSVFVLAERDGEVVGVSTAVPLSDEKDEVQRPFRQAGLDPSRVFYFGESVLRRTCRGLGVGWRFMREREQYARSCGGFTRVSFCAVERPVDHPARPASFRPLDAFWERCGFRKQPHLQTLFSWRDLGDSRETAKPMVFWVKVLDEAVSVNEGGK